jgi:hypothetical protein
VIYVSLTPDFSGVSWSGGFAENRFNGFPPLNVTSASVDDLSQERAGIPNGRNR